MLPPTPHNNERAPDVGEQALPAADEIAELEPEAVDNFMFEVSARDSSADSSAGTRSKLPHEQTEPTSAIESASQGPVPITSFPDVSADPQPKFPKAGADERRTRTAPRSKSRKPLHVSLSPGKSTPSPTPSTSDQKLPTSKTSSSIRKTPSWVVSLLAHGVVLIVLSFATLATIDRQDDLGLLASAPPIEQVEEFTDIPIDFTEELESLEEDLQSELIDPGLAAVGELAVESALADVSGETAVSLDEFGEMGSLFGDDGNGLSGFGEGLGAAATTSLFGTQVEANRVLFVVDNSGGMRRGELEMLIEELLRSVAAMSPKQQFYVLFYSDTVYPLFYPQPATEFVRATPENKERLQQWLGSVEFCIGNAVDQVIEAATRIRPEVVYLLTDGELQTTKTGWKFKLLLGGTDREFAIHTIGLGTGNDTVAADQLQQVADANRGTFRAVEISPDAAARANAHPRPYHQKPSGGIWGAKVGVFGRSSR